MNYFAHLSYRPLLREQAQIWKKAQSGRTLQRLAESSGIQPPYLTNALKERSHLSADQIYSLSRVFQWEKEALHYCLLLMEWERSGHKDRQTELKAEIDRIRKEKLTTAATLKKQILEPQQRELDRFFLNPYYSLIHSFMGVERFARNPTMIAQSLGLEERQFQKWLKDLVEMKFLGKEKGQYVKLRRNFHLPKDSPLCGPHLQLFSMATAQHLMRLNDEEKYNFTVTFSADPKARESVQREYLEFLKRVEYIVKEAPSEEVYGLRFDLFRWS